MHSIGAAASLTMTLLAATALAASSTCAEAAPNITVFGDSYSRVPRGNFPNWVTQLKQGGKISGSTNFARSGATAANVGSNTFASQVNRWRSAGRPIGNYTVVFLGINDIIGFTAPFTKSRAGYTSGVQALHDAKARLVLVQPHDIGTAPEFSGSKAAAITSRTKTWNSIVRSTASSYGAATVDLFKALGKVPKSLYADNLHLGQQGQGLIARAIAAKLGGGARVASNLRLGSQAQKNFQADTQAGLAIALAAPPSPGQEQLGLTAFPVGAAALPRAEAPDDPSRTQFIQAYASDGQDGGVGFRYALSRDATLGLTLASYDAADQDQLAFGSAGDTVRSDMVGLRLDQKVGAFALQTRMSYSNDHHATVSFDDLSGGHDRASFDGRTLELAQRLGYPLLQAGFTLTPWAELGYQRQETDSFSLASPYLNDQSYDTAPVTDMLGSVGLDLALAPIAIGAASWVTLSAGLAYTHGLSQDDYRITVTEAGLDGAQEEIVARPKTRTVAFDLGGSLALGEGLVLDSGVVLEHDLDSGTQETARVGFTYRF